MEIFWFMSSLSGISNTFKHGLNLPLYYAFNSKFRDGFKTTFSFKNSFQKTPETKKK